MAHIVSSACTDVRQLTAAEMGAIAASFSDKSEPKAVISNGVKINGEKYMTIESTDDSLKAKKVRATVPTSILPSRILTCYRRARPA